MHHNTEYSVAAHWKYKSGERSKEEIDKKLEWISKLLETEDETRDPEEFMQALKIDIFHDETFVFTPKGDVMALPQGATVIDFAYSIHSAVGHKMIGAKINGMIVPIDRVLQNGEIVEILTSSSSKGPSRDWLKIVTTSGAKNRIRQWFKKEKRADNIILGRSMIEGEIKKAGLVVNEAARTEAVENVAIRIGFSSAEDLYNTVGYGGIPISKVKNKIVDEVTKIISPAEPEPIVTEETMITAKPRKIRSNSGIIVDGESGCSVKYAKCCNPLPGDQVIGFITKGFGISIHKCDCPNVINGRNNPEYVDRWVSAAWDINDSEKRSLFEAHLQLRVDDRIGMLADISVALADMRVDILQINVQTSQGGSLVSLKVGCKNTDHYNSIVSRLRNIPGVYEVSRGFVK